MFNTWFPQEKDHLPLTWWRQHPVYLAAVLALVGVGSMVVFAVLGPSLMGNLAFTVDAAFRRLHLWTPVTYALVNPPGLWTLLGCYLLWSFGEPVERHLGRRGFVRMLLLLLAVSPLTITLLHLAGATGRGCAGMMQLEFGVFIAFATLYPRARVSIIILTLEVRVLAAIFVGLSALQAMAARDWVSLLLLAVNVGAAHLFIRYEKGELTLPSLPRRAPATPKRERTAAKPHHSTAVNDILDKISRHGMHSLTAEERRTLDAASDEMKRRSR